MEKENNQSLLKLDLVVIKSSAISFSIEKKAFELRDIFIFSKE